MPWLGASFAHERNREEFSAKPRCHTILQASANFRFFRTLFARFHDTDTANFQSYYFFVYSKVLYKHSLG